MSGCWVMVCGPSGAGKDSVLHWAAQALESDRRISFARRLVTRAPRAGADDDEIGASEIDLLRGRGGLAWHWEAHGQQYGVPARYAGLVADGRIVVVNGSREHALPLAGGAGVRCVLVTADAQVLAERLLRRGREDGAAIARRMERNQWQPAPAADRVIRNEGLLEASGAALRDYLLELAT